MNVHTGGISTFKYLFSTFKSSAAYIGVNCRDSGYEREVLLADNAYFDLNILYKHVFV